MPSTRAGARTQAISGVQTVDEGAEALTQSQTLLIAPPGPTAVVTAALRYPKDHTAPSRARKRPALSTPRPLFYLTLRGQPGLRNGLLSLLPIGYRHLRTDPVNFA
jgi:hypothetical protein